MSKPTKTMPKIGDDPNATRRQRFALLSHDLRSALNDVVAGLQLIELDALNGETRQQLERVSASGEVLSRLLDSILAEQDELTALSTPPATHVNLTRFLTDIDRRWHGQAQAKGIAFTLESSGGLPAIMTLDQVALERVIGNFISNAIKYTDQGEVRLSIFCRDNNALCFKVEDDGLGFSSAALARLFEYEGRPADTLRPGSGLGLYIAKTLADQLGGTIEVLNRVEAGTVSGASISLCLPHPSWFDRSIRKDQNPDLGPADLSHLTVLLAEDNATNQIVATRMLDAMGAKYVVASDGVEAWAILQKQSFDLGLLDIEMPRMSGLELIRKIRAGKGSMARMPLLALTAYVMREHRDRIYAAGADGIIAKPLMSVDAFGHAILNEMSNRVQPIFATPEQTELDLNHRSNEVVDRKIFDALVETIGPESSIELLEKLQADTDLVAEGIASGKHHLNLVEIRAQTHILISVAGAIGARHLQQIAQALNGAANQNETGDIDRLCDSCLSGLSELQGFISKEQDKAAKVA